MGFVRGSRDRLWAGRPQSGIYPQLNLFHLMQPLKQRSRMDDTGGNMKLATVEPGLPVSPEIRDESLIE